MGICDFSNDLFVILKVYQNKISDLPLGPTNRRSDNTTTTVPSFVGLNRDRHDSSLMRKDQANEHKMVTKQNGCSSHL